MAPVDAEHLGFFISRRLCAATKRDRERGQSRVAPTLIRVVDSRKKNLSNAVPVQVTQRQIIEVSGVPVFVHDFSGLRIQESYLAREPRVVYGNRQDVVFFSESTIRGILPL